jgi:hypothetical protein
LALAAGFCAPAAPAAAQEYCVACTGPAASYRCVVDGAQPGGRQPLQVLCITTMAKDGGHESCSVSHGTVFDCKGPVKHIDWAALNAPAQAAAPAPPKSEAPAATQPAPQAEPKTLVDLAKQNNEKMKKANEDFKESVRSANKTFGDAAKKTWDCMTSFFTRCGGGTP